GEQYVLALAGQGGAITLSMGLFSGNGPRYLNGRLIAFKLGADMQLPAAVPTPPAPLDVSGAVTSGDPLAGALQYSNLCFVCHGPAAMSAGSIPDLRFSATLLSQDAFLSIVLDGLLEDRGMVGFSADIGAQEAEDIRAYLLQQAAAVPR
ncbi:MAG: c-type cytochrome, partial [Pseudohongiellaceae bacterium]